MPRKMKVVYKGPGDIINVGGLGRSKRDVRPHRRGGVKSYPLERAKELIETSTKRAIFEKVK